MTPFDQAIAHVPHSRRPLVGMRRVAPNSDGPPAIFIDKDGTLLTDVPYNVEPSMMRLAPGALRGVCALAAAGYRLVIVSNQPGLALGLHTPADLERMQRWLVHRFKSINIAFTGFYWCPHHPQGLVVPYARKCDCRKPRPGLILRAANEHSLSLRESWVIGDVLDDVEAGRRAGCRTILVENGHEVAQSGSPLRVPDYRVSDLGAAADLILADASVPERYAYAR